VLLLHLTERGLAPSTAPWTGPARLEELDENRRTAI
jgi:hypothetical protein